MNQVYTQVTIDQRGVANLVLNRPEVHNAFDDLMIAELIQVLDNLAANEQVKVLMLSANGKNFSAGADINWMRSMAEKDYAQNLDDANELATLMYKLDKFPKPTLALVQGAAFGGAVGLVACCDIAIASDTASFCLSEVKIGLIPAVISPYVMRALGERQSRRYFLTAERFTADTARSLGLLHEIVSAAELPQKADALAEQLLQNSPAAMSAAKSLIHNIYNRKISNNVVAHTTQAIAEIRVSDEGQEGLSAFLEKRRPNWLPPKPQDN
ncbi:enoyl-CoA hydratase/isomerase family protein [Arsukibacterium sp. UBA3155]|uniref:enoyl-CoA hydratase/isomerase family protein n=1 Tax=Arsukibacterium sp. UBA3155 TaxID=1946058 RepID=UPI0025C32614|nr:enoyl-CoA hydratase/isomerase family protein [Arsukibacterium sp. UBA3155]|tara:strand:+ start:54201 stop:55007 length:807 start_codon:yes stop_codon:yes gene_type:complete